jgi:hypothetical protein
MPRSSAIKAVMIVVAEVVESSYQRELHEGGVIAIEFERNLNNILYFLLILYIL